MPGLKFPHRIVIDLGKTHDISGLQYLPRMESEVPGGIRNFRLYLRDTSPFKTGK